MRTLPALEEAFRTGQIGYTKAREVARIATPETDAVWTQRAAETTNRALERQVAAAEQGDAPPADPDAEPGPARVRVTVVMSAADADVLAATFARLRLDGGFGTDVEHGTLLAEMARRTLALLESDQADTADGAKTNSSAQTPTAERFRVALHRCPDCEKTHVGDPQARHHADATDLACAECDAEVLDLTTPDPAPRMKHGIPPATRRRVFEQYGHRCAVPHCRNRMWLDLHHIRPRHAGGDHRPANLACLCSVHHQMVHRGDLALFVDETLDGPARLRFVLPTGEVLGAPRSAGGVDIAGAVSRLRAEIEHSPGSPGRRLTGHLDETNESDGTEAGLLAVALDTLHALRLVVARPDDTWYGADRVVSGSARGVDADGRSGRLGA